MDSVPISGEFYSLSRYAKRKSCELKKRYTEDIAKSVAVKLSKDLKEDIREYWCRFCSHWHVGHYRPEQEKK